MSPTIPSEQHIMQLMQAISAPDGRQNLANYLKKITIKKSRLSMEWQFPYPITSADQLKIKQTLQVQLPADVELKLSFTINIVPHAVQAGLKTLPNIKNIIAVGSGKGGVGKSTTSVNLALALVQLGLRVGLLDADIYGPNQPQMLGTNAKPPLTANKKLRPIERFGLHTMSMGYLLDPQTPVVWRGPMISSAVQQLLFDTEWPALDYLIVDLPPGTGDVQLTLAKKVPLSGAVIVTTPQEVALQDAVKAVEMFNKTQITLLGILENMSMHQCQACGHTESIFGDLGGERMAKQYGVPLLGQLPLLAAIRESGDLGQPIMVAQPDSAAAKAYQAAAINLVMQLATRPKSYAHLFNVNVEST